MRFESVGKVSDFTLYGAKAGDYQFIVSWDERDKEWRASFKHRNFIDEPATMIDGSFSSQHLAEEACRKVWKQLRLKQ